MSPDWDRLFADRARNAEARAPGIAEELLAKYKTTGRAKSAARWKYHGLLAELIVERLQVLHAAKDRASPP